MNNEDSTPWGRILLIALTTLFVLLGLTLSCGISASRAYKATPEYLGTYTYTIKQDCFGNIYKSRLGDYEIYGSSLEEVRIIIGMDLKYLESLESKRLVKEESLIVGESYKLYKSTGKALFFESTNYYLDCEGE